jgi:hypothetical protein
MAEFPTTNQPECFVISISFFVELYVTQHFSPFCSAISVVKVGEIQEKKAPEDGSESDGGGDDAQPVGARL